MGRELHHRKKDDKYALWSTIVDDYVTEFLNKETIRHLWYQEKYEQSRRQVDEWMERIDKEVD